MKIGGWFKDCDKIQKSVRRDPNPGVPFCDAPLFIGDKFESLAAGAVAILIILFIIVVWVF